MLTVKLVVIGASGVGKTSFRAQYIAGHFVTGYRATIGADFIAKTLPHPTRPDEVVTLQIWDTAGQERFSSLSSAFFRGADAVLLMFDVSQPETLTALTKWWQEFRERAPLYDDDLKDFCCVVVGNKTDLVDPKALGSMSVVSEAQALTFLDDLVPPLSPRPTSPVGEVPIAIEEAFPEGPTDDSETELSLPSQLSIDINQSIDRGHSKRSRWNITDISNGTLSSTHTGVTSHHGFTSSLSDAYGSARSSPFSPSPSLPLSSPVSIYSSSSSSTTSSSAPTITPSLFIRTYEQAAATTLPTPAPVSSPALDAIPSCSLPPERGPKLFFTSAKTGERVTQVIEYIARRVVTRWEYEEALDTRMLYVREPSEIITLGSTRREPSRRLMGSCC